jgi:hypothetical protein
MSKDQSNHSVEDEHIESAEANPSPLEAVQQHQKELQQAMQQTSEDVQERRSRRHHGSSGARTTFYDSLSPQRNKYGAD